MAAEAVLTLSRMPLPAAAPSSSSAGAAAPAPASPSSASGSDSADGARTGAHATTSQSGQAAGSATPARSAAASSEPSNSKPSGRSGSAESGDPSVHSESGRPGARPAKAGRAASAVPSAPAPTGSAQTATATANFSAALAQSLAASPTGQAAQADNPTAPNIPSSNASGPCDAGDSSEPPAKHSGTDTVSSALTLLQNALAGALLAVPAVGTAASPATATSGAPSQGGHIDAGSSSTAAVLTTLLAQNSATDPKSAGSNSAATPGPDTTSPSATAPSATASPTAATNAAATALASLPLAAGSALAAQHAKSDPSAMALSSPVGSSAWTDELGAKLTWMAGQGIESASLRLSPEHLGPLQVTISVHEGQTSVWFGAAQPDTRTALQQSLPQLRQLFASQGLTLADAGVSREPPRGHTRQQPSTTASAATSLATVAAGAAAGQVSIAGGAGLLDTYV